MLARLSLRAQLMLLLSLAALGPTALLGALAIRHARHDVREEVLRGNLALIRAIGHQLNATLQDTRRALLVAASSWADRSASVSSSPSSRPATPPPAPRVLRRLRDEFSLLRTVAALDRDGRRIAGERLRVPLHLANSYGGYVSEVLFSKERREVLMVVQARDRRGALVGFLAAVVDLSFVGQRLAEARLGADALLLVVDGAGRLVASSAGPGARLPLVARPRRVGTRPLRDLHPAVDRVLATHTEGHLTYADAAGREWIAVYRNIAGMSEFRAVRWGVVLSQPQDKAFALALKTTRDTILVAVVVLAFALGTGALVARRMIRPLGRLVDRTDRLGAGELGPGLEGPLLGGSAEITQLSKRFAWMVERLRSSRERLFAMTELRRNLVRSIPLGVISVDREGTIRSINPAQERLSEVAADEVIGRRLLDVFGLQQADGAEAGDELRRKIVRALAGGEAVDLTLDNRVTPFTPTARLRYRLRISPLRDREGNVAGAVLIQEDLSLRARLEQQLLRSEKLSSVGVLAAGVAHEINNPLTTILGYAKLLLETRREEDPDHGPLSLIAEEAQRVQAIVRALLDFSRHERAESSAVSLNDVIDRTLTLASLDLRKRGIEVERHLAPALPPVVGDSSRLEQVFINLVTNAAQAMTGRPDSKLRVSTDADDIWVVAEIGDNGPGISDERLGKIFDPFFTTKDPGEGTGLGLSVSHRIVASHGGEIEVSTAPKTGTTFRVRLPRAPGP